MVNGFVNLVKSTNPPKNFFHPQLISSNITEARDARMCYFLMISTNFSNFYSSSVYLNCIWNRHSFKSAVTNYKALKIDSFIAMREN